MKSTLKLLFWLLLLMACDEQETPELSEDRWVRHPTNPVFRDEILTEPYEAAGDPHVFFDEQGELWMIYTGDVDGRASIKLAKGNNWDDWQTHASLLFEVGPAGLDYSKETAFYRRSSTGKHQIYYIGYPDNDNYESQLYLAEADELQGPYQRLADPIISRGLLAGKQVEVITSPSVIEHGGRLYMTFLGWDSFQNVTQVWVIGAISDDDGHTWQEVQEVDVPIGMEGQLTKATEGWYIAVRTGEYEGEEAIFMASSAHPFGPWEEEPEPLLTKAGAPWEIDEIIAPQITLSPLDGKQCLYYTGADHQKGWWVMLATRN